MENFDHIDTSLISTLNEQSLVVLLSLGHRRKYLSKNLEIVTENIPYLHPPKVYTHHNFSCHEFYVELLSLEFSCTSLNAYRIECTR